jgi:hypothetical protein
LGEGGAKKSFVRIRRSPSDKYYCSTSHDNLEGAERRRDEINPKVSEHELTRFRANPPLQAQLKLVFVVCLECGRKFRRLSGPQKTAHLYARHHMSTAHYLKKWPGAPLTSKFKVSNWTPELRQAASVRRTRFWEGQKRQAAELEHLRALAEANGNQNTPPERKKRRTRDTVKRISVAAYLELRGWSEWEMGPVLYPSQNIKDNAYRSVYQFLRETENRRDIDAEKSRFLQLSHPQQLREAESARAFYHPSTKPKASLER